MVLVTGDPGMGKTHQLAHLRRRAEGAYVCVDVPPLKDGAPFAHLARYAVQGLAAAGVLERMLWDTLRQVAAAVRLDAEDHGDDDVVARIDDVLVGGDRFSMAFRSLAQQDADGAALGVGHRQIDQAVAAQIQRHHPDGAAAHRERGAGAEGAVALAEEEPDLAVVEPADDQVDGAVPVQVGAGDAHAPRHRRVEHHRLEAAVAVAQQHADVVVTRVCDGQVELQVAQALGISLETTFTSKNGRPMKIANGGAAIKELLS